MDQNFKTISCKTLRAKRAMFTFWVVSAKNGQFGEFLKWDILADFQTLCGTIHILIGVTKGNNVFDLQNKNYYLSVITIFWGHYKLQSNFWQMRGQNLVCFFSASLKIFALRRTTQQITGKTRSTYYRAFYSCRDRPNIQTFSTCTIPITLEIETLKKQQE